MTKPEGKTKGMCIATRCTSVEQFIQMFHRFVDEDSFFVSTLNTRPPGLETSFSVQLQNGTPVLRGMCVVRESWTTPNNPFKTPGVRLGIKRLTANSTAVFEQLLVSKRATAVKAPPPPPPKPGLAVVVAPKTIKPVMKGVFTETAPNRGTPSRVELRHPARPPTPLPIEAEVTDSLNEPTAVNPNKLANKPERPTTKPGEVKPTEVKLGEQPDLAPPPADDQRTPGSDLVLPANPLMNLSDDSLDGYVECTLYEETGNFFPAEDDVAIGALLGDVIEPPPPAPEAGPPVVPTFAPPPRPVTPTFKAPPRLDPEIVSDMSETTPIPVHPGSPSLPPIAIAPTRIESAPVITARGSVPAVEHAVATASPRKSRRWWLLGLPLLLGVGAAGVYFSTTMHRESEATAKPAVAKPAVESPPGEKVAEVDTEKHAPGVVPPSEAEKPAPPVDGAPVVGDGPCRVVVASTPAGSMVQLDDKVIAPSPITIATTCAPHKVDISHARYQTVTRMVTLAERKQQSIDVNLPRPTHSVKVTSEPTGATIFIKGRRAGTTPTVLKVLGWETITLDFKKTGYQPASEHLYSRRADDSLGVRLMKW